MATNPKQLSPTQARSVPSISIKATTPEGKLISIGGIKSMERRITRDMTRRRELDSDIPGVTVEIIPGAVTTFELTIERAMMYKSNLLEAFGIGGVEDLVQQSIPFEIHEVRNNLDGTSQTIVYKGCYMKENPMSIDIDREWIIFQRASIEVATAIVTGNTQAKDITPDIPGVTFNAGGTPPQLQ